VCTRVVPRAVKILFVAGVLTQINAVKLMTTVSSMAPATTSSLILPNAQNPEHLEHHQDHPEHHRDHQAPPQVDHRAPDQYHMVARAPEVLAQEVRLELEAALDLDLEVAQDLDLDLDLAAAPDLVHVALAFVDLLSLLSPPSTTVSLSCTTLPLSLLSPFLLPGLPLSSSSRIFRR